MILIAIYKKSHGILLKLALENLEISGNFVLEIGLSPCIMGYLVTKYLYLVIYKVKYQSSIVCIYNIGIIAASQ